MRIRAGKEKRKVIEYVWLIYYIIIYTFNCAFDNMQMFSTILLFVICFFSICFHKNIITLKKIDTSDSSFWYGLFFVFSSMSVLWSSKEGISQGNLITTLIQILVFFICFDWYVRTERDIQVFWKWFCIACVFFASIVFITSPVYTYNSLEFGQFTGMHRNTTGYVLLFGCIFNLYYGYKYKKKNYYVGSIICLVVSLLTGSRKIIIGYLLVLLLWIFFQKNIKKAIQYFIAMIIMLVILIPIFYQIPYVRDTFGSRLLAIFDSTIYDGSVLARERAKQLAIVLFGGSPIIGNGWNAVSANYASYWGRINSIYAHNNYLELAADFGIIGVLLFYWKFVKETFYCMKRARQNSDYRFLTICLLIILILDYGQVTYCYLYMMSIYVIIFKQIYFLRKNEKNNNVGETK